MSEYTDEQLAIIETSQTDMIVDALPGSGKTFTMVGKAIHEAKKGKQVLVITHTRDAANTFRSRVARFGGLTRNVTVQTIHSLAYKYSKEPDYDKMLATAIGHIPDYDYVIVDEAQDISELQYQLINSINGYKIFVGDRNQFIFGWAGAVVDLFDHLIDHGYKYFTLSYTFRTSGILVDFINIIKETYGLKGPKLKSYYDFKTELGVRDYPLKTEFVIVRYNFNKSDIPNLSLNIHQMKGKEFNNVYLYIDPKMYGKDTPLDISYLIYVAATRAKKSLYLSRYIRPYAHYIGIKENFRNLIKKFINSTVFARCL